MKSVFFDQTIFLMPKLLTCQNFYKFILFSFKLIKDNFQMKNVSIKKIAYFTVFL